MSLGEFRLHPPAIVGSAAPLWSAPANNYLTLSLTQIWNESLFDAFHGANSCLIIHDTEEFGERIHRAAQMALPSWVGIDAAVSYGAPSPLGAVFSKARSEAKQQEWMFAWRPTQSTLSLNPVIIQIGSIEGIAELRDRSTTGTMLH